MKFLIVLCAALACASAKPQLFYSHLAGAQPLAYSAYSAYSAPVAYTTSAVAAAPTVSYTTSTVAAAPAVAYSAPAVAYSAPAVAYSAPAVAYSAPAVVAAPAPAVVAAPVAAKSQYHAQDELGQASYGHAEPTQTHNAVQDAFGNKVGSFSYTSPDGRVLRTDYVADALGYRVTSNALSTAPAVAAAALPLPVQDTPEVAIAKAQHLAAHHRIAKRAAILVQTPASTAPLATAIATPLTYHAVAAAPVAYASAPFAYTAHHAVAAAPLAYTAHHAVAAPLAYSAAPVLRDATLTSVVNTPGHAVSYRVD